MASSCPPAPGRARSQCAADDDAVAAGGGDCVAHAAGAVGAVGAGAVVSAVDAVDGPCLVSRPERGTCSESSL